MRIDGRKIRPLRLMSVVLAIGIPLLLASAMPWFHTAGAVSKEPGESVDSSTITDDLQRSFQLDNYTVVAENGPGRGEVIYFYKCWMCHNKYAKGGPYLQDLYKQDRKSTRLNSS